MCKAGLREVAENLVQKAGKVASVLGASALVAGVRMPSTRIRAVTRPFLYPYLAKHLFRSQYIHIDG